MNAITFTLPVGYLTRQFQTAGKILASAPAPESLLDLLLLADQRDNEKDSHTPPPTGHWDRLRDDIGGELLRLLDDQSAAVAKWRDPDIDWQPKMFRHALKSIPGLTGGELLMLFVQASETAYLHQAEAMQGRWESVASQCRTEILSRIADAQRPSSVIDLIGADNSEPDLGYETDDDSGYSRREMLRAAEAAFKPDMPDVRLLDLYLLVEACGGPDDDVFDDIEADVTELLFARLRVGAPEWTDAPHVPGFDPTEQDRALTHVIGGKLSHADLVMAYQISFDNARPAQVGDRWEAVNSLCRGQILKRMAPVKSYRWSTTRYMESLLDTAPVANLERGGADEAEA